ncbi:MAG: hypothetical protein KDD65_17680 [Bacteroidetes bacterium]|nr:hypothetical protein [Bacteroidota bacterium]
MDKQDLKDLASTWWLSVVLSAAGLYYFLTRGHYTMMDNADLVIHEAGHFVFAFMGEPLRMAGGTLMQILLPGGLAAYAFWSDFRVATQLFLFWLGHNLINISVYAADARSQLLPLIGGPNARHDWHWMLGQLDILQYDHAIGTAFWLSSLVVFVVMALVPRQLF